MKILDLLFKKNNKKEDYVRPQPKMVPVLMPDGTIEKYNENFAIEDGKHCVVCHSKSYHTRFQCKKFREEQNVFHDQVRGLKIYDAEAQGYSFCYYCKEAEDSKEF